MGTWLGFVLIAIAFGRGWGTAPKPGTPLALSRREFGRVIRFGLPNGLNWMLEFTAFQLFVNVVVAGLGDTAVAALNVVIAINSLAFMPAFGLASAGAVLPRPTIGSGPPEQVWACVGFTVACANARGGARAVAFIPIPARLPS